MDTADNITTIGQRLGRIRKGAKQVAAGGRRSHRAGEGATPVKKE
ncbi:MAG: hypothetical protein ACRDT0_23185 [Pseudonocardiaceae bacterium]